MNKLLVVQCLYFTKCLLPPCLCPQPASPFCRQDLPFVAKMHLYLLCFIQLLEQWFSSCHVIQTIVVYEPWITWLIVSVYTFHKKLMFFFTFYCKIHFLVFQLAVDLYISLSFAMIILNILFLCHLAHWTTLDHHSLLSLSYYLNHKHNGHLCPLHGICEFFIFPCRKNSPFTWNAFSSIFSKGLLIWALGDNKKLISASKL